MHTIRSKPVAVLLCSQLEEMRKNEDPRLSFSTPEFKEAQRIFTDNFKVWRFLQAQFLHRLHKAQPSGTSLHRTILGGRWSGAWSRTTPGRRRSCGSWTRLYACPACFLSPSCLTRAASNLQCLPMTRRACVGGRGRQALAAGRSRKANLENIGLAICNRPVTQRETRHLPTRSSIRLVQ